jgi:hypothetical protein
MKTIDIAQHIHYEKRTGQFTWLTGTHKGRKAGTLTTLGYIRIVLQGHAYQAHRLAWALVKGSLPATDVDHVNGNRADNRWENLRVVSRRENAQNRTRPNKNNVSGFLGVSAHRNGRWLAQMCDRTGAKVYLGLYHTPQAAHRAYTKAKEEVRLGNN